MKSWNIIFTGPQQCEFVQEDLPGMSDDQILCRSDITYISIGTESHCYNATFDKGSHWDNWVKYPFHPGYSNVGIVEKVGKNVTKFKPGDRVRSGWHHRQYFLAKEGDLNIVPDEVDSASAAMVPLAGVSQKCIRKCEIKMGDTVAIIGQGPVGQFAIQFARTCGAYEIISIDPAKERAEAAKLSGADYVLSCTAEAALEDVTKITNGKLVDIVIDTTGHPAALAQAALLVRGGGKIAVVGDAANPSQQVVGKALIEKGSTIIGCGGTAHKPEDTPYYQAVGFANMYELNEWTHALTVKYLQKKRLNFTHLLSHTFSPADAPKVYADLQKNRSSYMGVVFDWKLLDK